MKVAFFHNPKAGAGNLQAKDVIRLLQDDGHQVLYVSIKDKNWERVFGEPIDRAIVAGGDGTVSRLAPWLAGTNVPFCILPLGTANNCARSLDQMCPVEEVLSRFDSAPTKMVDLGILTSPDGHRVFIESAGLALLAIFMSEMRLLEKKNGSRERLSSEKRLFDAMKYLGKLTKPFPGAKCNLLLDDEVMAGDFLILEVSNMRFIGPNLDLFPDADPRDGQLDVVSVDFDRRKEWREYLKAIRHGEKPEAPVKTRRCRKVVFRCVEIPAHVDGKVFLTMAMPISVRSQPGVLEVIDFSSHAAQ
jgi:diacylglycerol kinase (ATP)